MLVTLLVIWVVVVPALTVAGTYLLSRVMGRRFDVRREQTGPLDWAALEPTSTAAHPAHAVRSRRQPAQRRTRDHAVATRVSH